MLFFQNSPWYKFSLFEGKPSKQPLFLCLKSNCLAKQWIFMDHTCKPMGTARSFAGEPSLLSSLPAVLLAAFAW